MRITFDTYGNEKQKQAAAYWCDDVTTDFVYGGAKYCGKSYLGCSLVFGDAMIYPGTNYFIARKKLNDLRKYTRPTIHEVFDNWKVSDKYWNFNAMDNYYEMYNGSMVFLLEARYLPEDEDFKRFGSMNMTRGVLEEAGELTREAKNGLFITTGRWKNEIYGLRAKLLQTCNPTKNYLYDDYYAPYIQGKLPAHQKFVQAFPADNKKALRDNPEYFENLDRTLTGNDRERLLLGNWDYANNPNALIPDYGDIADAFNCISIIPESTGGALASDLALRGRDRWVVVHQTGNEIDGVCLRIMSAQLKSEAPEIEKYIREQSIKLNIRTSNIIADSDGLGQFLGGYIRGITEFHTNERAANPKLYRNIKTECAYKLAMLFNIGSIRIIAEDEKQIALIKQELNVLRAKLIDSDGVKELIDKDEMKRILGRSPDFLETLIMAMRPFVKKQKEGIRTMMSLTG